METVQRKPITVMIVDDSSVYRNMLRSVLAEDPEIEVIAQAVNGRLALPRIKHYKPDILILDNEMPEMTGLETLEALKVENPSVGVIMFSSHTIEGARVTIKALELGALDFVTKPHPGEGDPAEVIRKSLVDRIKSIMAKRRSPLHPPPPVTVAPVVAQTPAATTARPPHEIRIERPPGFFNVCAIGISTGGPAALRELLPKIPAGIRGSILIVQHMPPIFTRQLADSLNAISAVRVVEGGDGMLLENAVAYIAPGGKHMVVERNETGQGRIRITDDPPEANCKPSVNVLFRSVASVFGQRAVGIIMTGMGTDGYAGMKELKNQGSFLIAQTESSCLVFGMPSLPTREGMVDESLDIAGIAGRVNYLLGGNAS